MRRNVDCIRAGSFCADQAVSRFSALMTAFTVQPGEVKTFDDIVQSMFNAPGDGG